jgi:thiamine biosynthesis lipoprotein
VSSRISSLLLALACLLPAQQKFVAEEAHMGTVFRITLYGDDAQVALRAAFDRVADLDAKLSDYKPDSELNRVCRTAFGYAVPVSEDLFRVLKTALQLSADSDGAFDVTLGPVIRLWRWKQVPDPTQIERALKLVGYRNVLLGQRSVELKLPGMQLDLGAIAKGYAAEQALHTLREHGISRALVAASGDLAIGDAPPEKAGWTVALETLDERRVVQLHNTCAGTSGDAEQFVESAGVRYSHIVDPRSGMGLAKRIGVTVISADCMLADALGTAVSVVTAQRGIDAGYALAKKYRAEALIRLDPVGAAKEDHDHQQDDE